MNTLNAHGIKSTDVLDAGCRFTAQCPDYEGMYVFDANKPILRNLRNGDGPLARSRPSIARSCSRRRAMCTPTRIAGVAPRR